MDIILLHENVNEDRLKILKQALCKHWYCDINAENKDCDVKVFNIVKDFITHLSKANSKNLVCVSLYDTMIPLYNAGETIRAFNSFKKKILIPNIQFSKNSNNGKLFIAETKYLLKVFSNLQNKKINEIPKYILGLSKMTDAVHVDEFNNVICIITKEYEPKITLKDGSLLLPNNINPHIVVLDDTMIKYYNQLVRIFFNVLPSGERIKSASTPISTPSRYSNNNPSNTRTSGSQSNVHTIHDAKQPKFKVEEEKNGGVKLNDDIKKQEKDKFKKYILYLYLIISIVVFIYLLINGFNLSLIFAALILFFFGLICLMKYVVFD